jgi:hypothetical protein
MPRLAMGAVIALLILGFYYYEPLRTALLAPGAGKSSGAAQKAATPESPFDPKAVELFALGKAIANLQGKVEVLKLAQENRAWFKDEEYAKVPAMLQETEATLKKAEAEYERLRTEYARETATKLVRESIAQSLQHQNATAPQEPTPQKAP